MSLYLTVILLSFMSVFTTAAGVMLALRFRESPAGVAVGIGFSAGIMLLVSCLELIPESVAQTGVICALSVATAGGLVLYALHLVIPHTHLIDEATGLGAGALKSAYLVVFGLILHDFPEGFAMANSYVASPSLGILVAIAIALHNLPEEFAMAVPAVLLRRKVFLYSSALLSALAEPLGAIVGLVAVDFLPGLNPLFIAFAAGAMIFVSIHELAPLARRYGNLSLFVVGVALSGLVYLTLNAII
ncbi:MAG: ZIP family metal transporter [Pseudomonadota bacterium]|nr:ZIP family metal transporter [Pseudomonadota bacterium]